MVKAGNVIFRAVGWSLFSSVHESQYVRHYPTTMLSLAILDVELTVQKVFIRYMQKYIQVPIVHVGSLQASASSTSLHRFHC